MENLQNDNKNTNLIIGTNNNNEIFISQKNRYLNMIVLGKKGTGKTSKVLPTLASQDLQNKKIGMTLIVTKKEMAYTLNALAKEYDREVVFLKVSTNIEILNHFLFMDKYEYDYINENIINYKEAIKKKKIVIIDMEVAKYKYNAINAVKMLLLQLTLDIQETDITQRNPHILYIDDSFYYLDSLEYLLNYSDDYNIGLILFFQSRNQFLLNNKDYTALLDNNIRTTILLNSLNVEDVQYYQKRIYEKKNPSDFYQQHLNSFLYESLKSTGVRIVGSGQFKFLDNEFIENLEKKSKRLRNKLIKNTKDEYKNKNMIKDISYLEGEPTPVDPRLIFGEDISHNNKEIDILIKSEDNHKQSSFGEMEKEKKRKISSFLFNKESENISYVNNNFDYKF
ncbi:MULTISPECIES: conjugal transfer protein TraG [unclassified Clostridioides]|uniref:conjugal transfer protein TraG n=1 Tax=unclassified Clostridioides TaxID=2635829 RepID=UPI001D11F481|nr:conjugal transfer protein TraG [Clostridioides sp. ES-S-0145-01]MCC0681935.1 conjugal transfer protein TraG [Clostridioides sp. ES-S-0005-03]MCC0709315.1 conjugal transfer protein TraG [Clostridioides sp. ES-S-0190-01]UDN64127.1 conjugal transfer protein TraG [Clostridioides sp. ES-W-0016-02]